MKSITYIGAFLLGGLAMIVAPLSVHAATFNDQGGFRVLSTSNSTQNQGTLNWGTTATASSGETVEFLIHYNKTSGVAQNVTVHLAPQTTGAAMNHSFTAQIREGGVVRASGTVSVNLTSSQSLSFVPGTGLSYPNGQTVGQPFNGTELFGSGFSIGNAGANEQMDGYVAARFLVSSSGTNPGNQVTVFTDIPTNITNNSATLRGSVNLNGASSADYRFEYGTNGNFNQVTTSFTTNGTGAFSANVTGLQSNTTYSYRIVANPFSNPIQGGTQTFTTSGGTTGGQIIAFTDIPTGVTQNGATLRGVVTLNGASSADYRFEYGTNGNFNQFTNLFTTNGGAVSVNLTGLQSNTSYSYRIVANPFSNPVIGGTQFFTTTSGNPGNQVTVFTDIPTNITNNSATLRGSVNLNGASSADYRFEYGTNGNFNQVTTSFTTNGTGAFSANVTGLQSNTTYSYRIVANPFSNPIQGGTQTFTTSGGTTGNQPIVQTNASSNVSSNFVTFNGHVDLNGNSFANTWFEYGTDAGLNGNTFSTNSNSQSYTGSFQNSVGNLSSNTNYYFRAIAQVPGQTAVRGSIYNFYTSGSSSGGSLYVETYAPTATFSNSATLRGYVNPNGSSNVYRWFEWGTCNTCFSTQTPQNLHGSSAGEFFDTVSGLSSNTTYYYRAVARETNGTVRPGQVYSFSTSQSGNTNQVIVTTNPATSVTNNSATFNGYVNANGNPSVLRWFEWGTTPVLGQTTPTFTIGNVSETFSYQTFNLSPNSTYYFRSVARGSNGIETRGATLQFVTGGGSTTNTGITTVVTNLATGLTSTSARLNSVVISANGTAHTGWFEWGTSATNLSNRTVTQNIGSSQSLSFTDTLSGIQPNTLYFYRAVVQNPAQGTLYGGIISFRTNSVGTIVTSGTQERQTVRTGLEIEKELINLESQNGTFVQTSARPGDKVQFIIRVENNYDFTLEDVVIRDRIPEFLIFANAQNTANTNGPNREVVWRVGDLREGERATVTLDVIVAENAPIGIVIENIALAESGNITQNSNETSIAVVGSLTSLGAASLFSGNFFPNTLIEWLIFALILLVIVMVSRAIYGSYETKKKVQLPQ